MAATMKSPISAADLTSIPDFIEKFKGVKSLVDSGITNIPDFYVRPKDERPGELDSTASVDQIPVFDLAALHGEGRGALVKAIGEACEEWGIFQVINHGVRSNVMKSMMGVSKGFFHLPMDEKMLYYSNVPSQPVRYGTSFNPLHESVLEWRDVLKHMVITSPPEENIQYWPDKPPAYREATKNYILEMMVVRTKILSAISEALGLDSNYLQGVFEQQMLGLNHYPECPNPDLALGISSHSDASGITILLQDGQVAALQALHQNRWVCVQPLPDSLVVIVGDQLQILSNGKYKSAEHRAIVNREKERVSIVTLFLASNDTLLAPIAKLLDKSHRPKYQDIKCEKYMQKYLNKQHNKKSTLDSIKLDK
ncbi:hypothetical protein O6H91_16G038700 [Diphasiastrum complanatum]|uniref:Uncharacterized protein n=2 Tax=Diphasiastrum complanatum TaxID=34168 RepID=A0ACC2BBM0_DIPCM|nr:hypothetical protein O6H91_16G038600 [Diphasiastrum complanatum]KAJ7527137.1 hypothetical protein O6H91_16G038700 [Diphasiastrum complanatum]